MTPHVYLFAALLLLPPSDPAPSSVDDLIARVEVAQKEKAEAAKREAAAVADLKAALGLLKDRLAKIGVTIDAGPTPPPTPPRPADELVQRFRDLLTADPASLERKREAVKLLVELYIQAAAFAADPTVLTALQLVGKIQAAARLLIPDATLLSGVRKAVAEELAKLFPADVELTAEGRARVAALYVRLAAALKEAAP